MTRHKLAAVVAALACFVTAPVVAATPKAPAQPAPEAPALPDPLGAPQSCPAVSMKASGLEATQRYVDLIAEACQLRASGQIEDYQFQMIRDKAIEGLEAELQIAVEKSQTQVASNP